MSLERLNRELRRLDRDLRTRQIDRAEFRARRRKLLLDYEDPESITAPREDATQTATVTVETPPAEPAAAPSAHAEPEAPRTGPGAKLIGVALAGTALVLAAGAWLLRDGPAPPSAPPPASAPGAMPQALAGELMQSAWAENDIATFLERWQQLAPEVVRASRDDPRIWALRGEVQERLDTARQALLLDASAANQARVEQLQRIDAVLPTP